MFAVQKVALGASDKELAAVGVFATVGHRQQAGSSVFVSKVLVSKRATINGHETRAIVLLMKKKITTIYLKNLFQY